MSSREKIKQSDCFLLHGSTIVNGPFAAQACSLAASAADPCVSPDRAAVESAPSAEETVRFQ